MFPERLTHIEAFVHNRLVAGGGAMIYMVLCEGYVKIGVATNAHARLAGMQTGNPFPMALLTSFQSAAPYEEEEAIHALLEPYRVRGEWFKLHDAMITHLMQGRSWKRLGSVKTEPEYSI